MVVGLVLAVVLVAISTALYSILSASLAYAQEVRESIQRRTENIGRKYKARCATCGVDFLESSEVEDGICNVCRRPVCSRCSAKGWLCPYCNKKRYENECRYDDYGRRKPSISSIIHSVMNANDDNTSSDSFSKWSQDSTITSGYSSSISVKCKLPDFGSDISNGWSSDYESDTGRSVAADNWEDNWLFKKKFPSHEYTKPLAMFVPKPNKLVKARIGGVDVDDLSDLSDYSDSEIDEIIK